MTTGATLLAALESLYAGNANLLALGLSGPWADAKPRGKPNPSLIFSLKSGSLWTPDDVSLCYQLRLSMSVVAATKADAVEAIGVVVAEYSNQTFAHGATFENKVYPLIVLSPMSTRDPAETAGGEKLFRESIEWQCRELRPRY